MKTIECNELIGKLRDAGFGPLVDALYDRSAYTSKGRLNVSGLARVMGISQVTAWKCLRQARDVLGGDL